MEYFCSSKYKHRLASLHIFCDTDGHTDQYKPDSLGADRTALCQGQV